MNPKNPLESVYFIDLPENFNLSDAAFPIDKTIQLPVQQKDSDAPGEFNPKEITMDEFQKFFDESDSYSELIFAAKNNYETIANSLINDSQANVNEKEIKLIFMKEFYIQLYYFNFNSKQASLKFEPDEIFVKFLNEKIENALLRKERFENSDYGL